MTEAAWGVPSWLQWATSSHIAVQVRPAAGVAIHWHTTRSNLVLCQILDCGEEELLHLLYSLTTWLTIHWGTTAKAHCGAWIGHRWRLHWRHRATANPEAVIMGWSRWLCICWGGRHTQGRRPHWSSTLIGGTKMPQDLPF